MATTNTRLPAPYLVDSGAGNADLGAKVFFICGTTCMGCLFFTYFRIPETKGLALEHIDILYRNTTPIHSVAYRNQPVAQVYHKGGKHEVSNHSDEKV